MRLSTARKAGFSRKFLHNKKDLPRQTIGYMKQRSSFLVAAFCLVAFITGNMMGQHGWYAFWKAALGQYDDSLITYDGTVTPIAFVPDYTKWALYGGNGEEHTYRQVPKDLLIPLPVYKQEEEKKDFDHAQEGDVFSIGHMGSYATGAEGDGSHIGVDIRVAEGTPVRAIANGIVTRVANDPGGFGKLIVIRHPHMPDPDRPEYETVLHSVYAHLSTQYVVEGDVVHKGQEIGLSGKTGFATGPHLHFQVDRDDAPWHPYWAFSYSEAREAGFTTAQAINAGLHQDRGYTYTVHPMLTVQANYPPAKYKDDSATFVKKSTTLAKKPAVTKVSTRKTVTGKTIADSRDARKNARLARIDQSRVIAVAVASSSSVASSAPIATDSAIVQTMTVASGTESAPSQNAPVLVVPKQGSIASIEIQHDRTFEGRTWETIRLTLQDSAGQVITDPSGGSDLYMRTAYGEAEFDPPVLSPLDFVNGRATVRMLPRGARTIVILIEPYKAMSKPMEYVGE